MRFVYLDSRFTLHASSPRSVALTQLRFACLAVASLAGDLHPEECAHAGRTRKNPNRERLGFCYWWSWRDLNPRPQIFHAQFYMFSGLI